MNKLIKDRLNNEEIKYLSKEEEFKKAYIEYTSDLVDALEEVQKLGKEREKLGEEKERIVQEKEEIQQEKEKAQKEKEDVLVREKKAICRMFKAGSSIKDIAEVFEMDLKIVKNIIDSCKN